MEKREEKVQQPDVGKASEYQTSIEREEFLASLRHGGPVSSHRKSYYPGADSYHPSRAIKSSVKSS